MFLRIEKPNLWVVFGGATVFHGEKINISNNTPIVSATKPLRIESQSPETPLHPDQPQSDTAASPNSGTVQAARKMIYEGKEYLVVDGDDAFGYVIPSDVLSRPRLAFNVVFDRDVDEPTFQVEFASPGAAQLPLVLNGEQASIRLASLSMTLKAETLNLTMSDSAKRSSANGPNACGVFISVRRDQHNEDASDSESRCVIILALSKVENDEKEFQLVTETIEGAPDYVTFDPDFRVIGEGQFGIVYAGRDSRYRRCAIKIFFERQFSTTAGTLSASKLALERLRTGCVPSKKEIESEEAENIFFNDLYRLLFENKALRGDAKKPIDTAKILKMIVDSSGQRLDLVRTRFIAEWEVAKRIHRKKDRGGNTLPSLHFVDAFGCSEQFTQSAAYGQLEELQRSSTDTSKRTLNLSDYAIIMEYCSYTLQDFLQGYYWRTQTQHPNDANQGQWAFEKMGSRNASEVSQTSYTGYSLIRRLSARDRVIVIKPFILGMLDGLIAIHGVGVPHHDIKPANLFVVINDQDIVVKIGDFSFAAKLAESTATSETVLRDVIQTGTAHYKSPEQRDFVESYYVRLASPKNADTEDDSTILSLEVLDPKFAANFVGIGDQVVFSCDKTGRTFDVASIPKPVTTNSGDNIDQKQDGKEVGYFDKIVAFFDQKNNEVSTIEKSDSAAQPVVSLWRVKIKGAELDIQRVKSYFGPAADRRLVHFFKIPSLKTDVYGVGALCFDLFTGGNSSQRFYEAIRGIDWNQRSLGMKDVLEKYTEFMRAHRTDSKSLDLIFGYFRCADGSFPPGWFLQFILQCMTYYIPGNPWSYERLRSEPVTPKWASEIRSFFNDGFQSEIEGNRPEQRWIDDPDNMLVFPNRSRILAKLDAAGRGTTRSS